MTVLETVQVTSQGFCRDAGVHCAVNAECCPGRICSNSTCIMCAASGSHCAVNNDCCSGRICSNSTCLACAAAGSHCENSPCCAGLLCLQSRRNSLYGYCVNPR